MKKLICKHISGKRLLLFLFLANAVYAVMLFFTIPWLTKLANGMKPLDMMTSGYSAEYVDSLFKALGPDGRNAYLSIQVPLDIFYPLFFGVAYSLFIAYFLNKLNKLDGIFFYLCYLPVIAFLFDYLENMGIVNLLFSYPVLQVSLIKINSVFTILKGVFSKVSLAVCAVLFLIFSIKKLISKFSDRRS